MPSPEPGRHRSDRYGSDVLNGDWRVPPRGRAVEVEAGRGLVVEEVTTDWCGEIVAVERDLGTVVLEDRRGKRRTFPLGAGFLLDGAPVVLVPPVRSGPVARTRTASGSLAAPGTRARVARASRIFVEGRHDAELVEKVWGDDLRVDGVVVEHIGGVDELPERLRDFRPGPERRVGVLVDHLVAGSKESRIATSVTNGPQGSHVLVVGHPFVDIWAAVKPHASASRRGRRSPGTWSGRRVSASVSAGHTGTRPTSPEPGGRFSAGSRRSRTSSRACSAASRSSSTS